METRLPEKIEIDESLSVPPASEGLARPDRWRCVFERRWANPGEHINVKEAMALLAGLRRASHCPSLHGSRLLSLTDSLVLVCAYDKSRGRAPPMARGAS